MNLEVNERALAADSILIKIEDEEEAMKEAEREKKIMLYIFDSGVSTENVIYYNHKNTVTFNWSDLSHYKKISKEDFQNFLESVDYSQLPEGVKFEMK